MHLMCECQNICFVREEHFIGAVGSLKIEYGLNGFGNIGIFFVRFCKSLELTMGCNTVEISWNDAISR